MLYKKQIAATLFLLGTTLFVPSSMADDQQQRIGNDDAPVTVPVPATLALFGLGVGLLAIRNRR